MAQAIRQCSDGSGGELRRFGMITWGLCEYSALYKRWAYMPATSSTAKLPQ